MLNRLAILSGSPASRCYRPANTRRGAASPALYLGRRLDARASGASEIPVSEARRLGSARSRAADTKAPVTLSGPRPRVRLALIWPTVALLGQRSRRGGKPTCPAHDQGSHRGPLAIEPAEHARRRRLAPAGALLLRPDPASPRSSLGVRREQPRGSLTLEHRAHPYRPRAYRIGVVAHRVYVWRTRRYTRTCVLTCTVCTYTRACAR